VRSNDNGLRRWTIRFVSAALGVGLMWVGVPARGQSTTPPAAPATTPPVATAAPLPTVANPRTFACPKASLENVQTIYFNNVVQPNDGNEIQTAVRNLLPADVKIDYAPEANALILCATPDLVAIAQKIVHDLDRPRTTYRLTYTITEMDGGRRVGTPQHFALIVAPGQRTTVKLGSKVPIPTGSGNQFQYIDVGINFDAALDEVAGGARLKSKVDQSSVAAESVTIGPLQQPVVRQATLEGTSMLTLGKPLMLGSLDIPGGAAHLDVEVLMELVK